MAHPETLDPSIPPWERQPGETPESFRLFMIYRDMTEKRSISAVGRAVGRAAESIYPISHKWSWQKRALAWDVELDREKRLAQKRRAIQAGIRHADIALSFQEKIIQRIQNLDPAEIATANLPTWLETAVKIERQALGMAAEVIEYRTEDADEVAAADIQALIADPEMARLIDRLGEKLLSEHPAPRHPSGD